MATVRLSTQVTEQPLKPKHVIGLVDNSGSVSGRPFKTFQEQLLFQDIPKTRP